MIHRRAIDGDFAGALAHGVVGVSGFELAAFVDLPQPAGVVVFKAAVAAVVAGAIACGVVHHRPRGIGVQLVAVEDVVVGVGQGIDAIAGASEVGLPRRAE